MMEKFEEPSHSSRSLFSHSQNYGLGTVQDVPKMLSICKIVLIFKVGNRIILAYVA